MWRAIRFCLARSRYIRQWASGIAFGLLINESGSIVGRSINSHPQDVPEVRVKTSWTVTLAATSQYVWNFGSARCSENELVLVPAAEGARLSTDLPPDGSDFAKLLLHRQSLLMEIRQIARCRKVVSRIRYCHVISLWAE